MLSIKKYRKQCSTHDLKHLTRFFYWLKYTPVNIMYIIMKNSRGLEFIFVEHQRIPLFTQVHVILGMARDGT